MKTNFYRRSIYPRLMVLFLSLLILAHPSLSRAVTYTYDALGRLTKAIYAPGHELAYSYDAAGNLLTVTLLLDNEAPAVSISSIAGNYQGLRLKGNYGYWGPDEQVFWNNNDLTINYVVSDNCDPNPSIAFQVEWEGEPKNTGVLDPTAKTIIIDPSELIGKVKVTITATDESGNSASGSTELTIVLFVPEQNLIIKPEMFFINWGMVTAFLRLPSAYDCTSIRDAKCDGAPLRWMNVCHWFNKAILYFRQSEIEALPMDTSFVLRGTFTYNGKPAYFQAADKIWWARKYTRSIRPFLRGQAWEDEEVVSQQLLPLRRSYHSFP